MSVCEYIHVPIMWVGEQASVPITTVYEHTTVLIRLVGKQVKARHGRLTS